MLHWALDYLLMPPSVVAAVQHLTLEQITTRIEEGTVDLTASTSLPASSAVTGDPP